MAAVSTPPSTTSSSVSATTGGRIKAVYVPAAYTPPAPAALAPVTNPLPAEITREKELARRQKAVEKQRKYEAQQAAQRSKGGFFNSLAASVIQGASTVEGFIDKAYDEVSTEIVTKTDEASLARFRKLGYPITEALIMDFHCNVSTGACYAEGYLSISTHYLTFDGKIKALFTASKQDESLAFAIPLASIVSIQPAVSLRALEKGRPPQLQINHDLALANSILVYTKENHVHQFFDFRNYFLNWFSELWNVIDHAWRAQLS
ncbi:hypothetical protein Pelo_8216 [Pelomyxa schiedti]|nr:hypothetical protein Pelo_8216 [Pelomyxa schiedti]